MYYLEDLLNSKDIKIKFVNNFRFNEKIMIYKKIDNDIYRSYYKNFDDLIYDIYHCLHIYHQISFSDSLSSHVSEFEISDIRKIKIKPKNKLRYSLSCI